MASTGDKKGPVGDIKKLVSLVDRGAFDNVVYPQTEKSTVYQPRFETYHPFTTDVHVWPYAGAAEWGKRLTFSVPQPWETDMISWIALRLRPSHWLPGATYRHLYITKDWEYVSPAEEWVWAKSLGSVAISKAELEIDGVTVEQWSGDWIDVWSRTALGLDKGVGWDDGVLGPLRGGEDGNIYCYLPFWFARHLNVSFPLISTDKPVRIHITLRPFREVVRMVGANKATCDDTPLDKTFRIRDLSKPFNYFQTVDSGSVVPTMEVAEVLCGTAMIDGELRKAYQDLPHELMMNPVVEMAFSEPLKYTIGTPNGETIRVGLPLTDANGPVRQILWFLRRKAAVGLRADWTNYSATLEGEEDAIWNPRRPLLRRAQLLVGTAVWADEEESWWRQTGALPLAGGIRAYGNYIYAYNFTEAPNAFDPLGSANASRVDIRLNLEVEQPPSASDKEWEVVVFIVGTNWMRFQNGIANRLFMD